MLELQESRQGLNWVQWSIPTTDHVLELLEQQRMRQSLHYFPQNAPLEVCVLIMSCCVILRSILSNYECGLINPRHACAERVTVVVLCVCMSVTHTLFWQYAQLKV